MNKALRFLQILWLVIGSIAIVFSAYSFLTGDTDGGIFFLVFAFISGIMYAVRKRQGKHYNRGPSEGKKDSQ